MKMFVVLAGLLTLQQLALAQARTAVTVSGSAVQVENAFIRLTLLPEEGRFSVLDKRCRYHWQPPAGMRFAIRNVRTIAGGVSFETDLPLRDAPPGVLHVTMTVPAQSPEVHILAEALQEQGTFDGMMFLAPLVLDSEDGALVLADYSNGKLYPLHLKPFPAVWHSLDRLDMPWVGVCDLPRGFGYALIVETADDGNLHCAHRRVGERELVAPQIGWLAQKGRFGYPRRMYYHFASSGGYVALAKAYRAHAKRQGLVVSLSEKVKRNPNLRRLFGAANLWGIWGVDYERFVNEVRAAGVTRLIINGAAAREPMQKAIDAGYITSEYDNYTDILPIDNEDKIDSTHDILPKSAVLKADGQRMTAWLTMEGQQYMKRCPALWLRTAQKVIPRALQNHPFIGRFIDVTTAEALYECYDPEHPLTRTQKRQCGEQLLAYVRSLGLVVGGEHGIWWAVPYLDYIEGMMSGGRYSWPAGHLIRPESKEQSFTDPSGNRLPPYSEYEQWGIGHRYRVPLWELVFHDCVVSTWYWGDSSDWLIRIDPHNMTRKDLFNILYATMPMMWLDPEGAWHKDRRAFLRTCYLTSKLHEALATQEMVSHEFVTSDRDVQRTGFADGTVAVVNFGEKPYSLSMDGRTVVLPQFGFWVKGPKIEQSRLLVNGQPVTTVQADGFAFRETPAEWVMLRRLDAEHVRLEAYATSGRVQVDLRAVTPRWDRRTTVAFHLTPSGRRERVPVEWRQDGVLALRAGNRWEKRTSVDILCGKHTRQPDVSVQIRPQKRQAKQGEPVKVALVLQNRGFARADNVQITLYADQRTAGHRLWQGTVSLGAGSRKEVPVTVSTSRLDGTRTLWVHAKPSGSLRDISEHDNSASAVVQFARNLRLWDYQRLVKVEAGSVDREDEVVVVAVESPSFAPESVRAYLCDERGGLLAEIPAQCDRLPDGRAEIAFIIPGRMTAQATKWVKIVAMSRSQAVLAPPAPHDWDARKPFILRETYTLSLTEGVPRDIAMRSLGSLRRAEQVASALPPTGEPIISHLAFSSEKTGWAEERGESPAQVTLVSHGPVRTVVQVRRELVGGVTYTKRYSFYGRYFDVQIDTSTSEGIYSRAYYRQDGDYEDSGGLKARVDGKGDAEGVLGVTREPRWYVVNGPGWTQACLSLTPADAIVYWDSAAKGGIGFTAARTSGVRLRYVIFPAATPDASFADLWYRRAMEPVRAVWQVSQR